MKGDKREAWIRRIGAQIDRALDEEISIVDEAYWTSTPVTEVRKRRAEELRKACNTMRMLSPCGVPVTRPKVEQVRWTENKGGVVEIRNWLRSGGKPAEVVLAKEPKR